MNHIEKIKDLIFSEDSANARLAVGLIKSQKIEIGLNIQRILRQRYPLICAEFGYTEVIQDLQSFARIDSDFAGFHPECSKLQNIGHLFFDENFKNLNSMNVLPCVTHVCFSNAYLSKFPDELILNKTITYLELSSNNINSLPQNIGNMSQLQYLNLSLNALKKIPSSFSNLNSLTHLYLRSNRFEEFPKVLLECASLETLDISGFHHINIPNDISQLKKLMYLKLSYKNKGDYDWIQRLLPNTIID